MKDLRPHRKPNGPKNQWAGRRSNPRLRFFRPPLGRLSYRPKRKKARRPLRRLALQASSQKKLDVTSAKDERKGPSPDRSPDARSGCLPNTDTGTTYSSLPHVDSRSTASYTFLDAPGPRMVHDFFYFLQPEVTTRGKGHSGTAERGSLSIRPHAPAALYHPTSLTTRNVRTS